MPWNGNFIGQNEQKIGSFLEIKIQNTFNLQQPFREKSIWKIMDIKMVSGQESKCCFAGFTKFFLQEIQERSQTSASRSRSLNKGHYR